MSASHLFQSGANIAMKVPATVSKATVAFLCRDTRIFLQVGTGIDSVF
jgi:hypothetical protein